jgi:hypothetical protein
LLRDGVGDGSAFDDAAIDELVSSATRQLDPDQDDPRWRLTDRIARLRDVDPGSIDLATDWLDVLLKRASARGSAGGRRGA